MYIVYIFIYCTYLNAYACFFSIQIQYRRKSYVCFEIFIYHFYLNLAVLPSRKSKKMFMAIYKYLFEFFKKTNRFKFYRWAKF
jgi:hypothetical protein